jgi:hypothetical protein
VSELQFEFKIKFEFEIIAAAAGINFLIVRSKQFFAA